MTGLLTRAGPSRATDEIERAAPLGLLSLAVALAISACTGSVAPTPDEPSAQNEPVAARLAPEGQLTGRAFGTTWSVRWVEPGPEARGVQAVRQTIEDELRLVDEQMSTWRDDSALSMARRSKGPVEVPAALAEVVAAALGLAAATDGAFDPTVQPLMELWGLHGAARATWPTDDEIAIAKAKVDWRRVQLTADGGRSRLDVGGTALDLSAIAKGYAVDRVASALAGLGLSSHFVEVGGEVRSAGLGPSGAVWAVGVSVPDPSAAPSELALIVRARDAAIATSGNYRNRVVVDGRVVHHTMDPRRGAPVETTVASVTVVARDCATADGWATALMVLPLVEGRRLVEERPELDAAWLIVDGDGFQLVASSGLSDSGPARFEIVHSRVRRADAPRP